MNAKREPSAYTTEKVKEIVDRIATLRARWLRVVEAQLASQRSGSGRNDANPAERSD
jgi:hypothetical protein